MLDSIVTSKTRIQLLLRFFMNPERRAYLRELATELGESSNGVRVELDRLEKAKLLESVPNGRTKSYQANVKHPLFPDIQNIVKKTLGIDRLIDDVITQLGSVRFAFITGDYAGGIDSGIIDLILVGQINRQFLERLVQKTEPQIGNRKIRTLVLTQEEFERLTPVLRREMAILEIYRAD
jgi:hypothetical protein